MALRLQNKRSWRGLSGLLAGMALLLASCAEGPVKPLNPGCLVFGGINMDQAPSNALTVVLEVVAGPERGTYYHIPVKDGVFYFENLGPGSYQFYSVWGHTGLGLGSWYFFGSPYEYDFGAQSGGFRVRRGEPVRYCGAFKIVKQGWFFSDKFSVEPDPAHGEKGLLTALLPNLDDDTVRAKAQRELEGLR